MFLLHRRFSRRYGTECHDLHMTNVMSSRRGCYDAVISGVIGPGQRGGSGGGRVKRGLRPRSASVNHCWGTAEGALPAAEVPVTRSGGSVLKAPVSIIVGAPQRGHYPSSGGGHAKRGLRPQGAPAPQRGHSPAWRDSKSCANTPTRASCTADTKIPVSNPKREKIRGSISS